MYFNEYKIHIAGFRHEITSFKELMDKINELNTDCTIQPLNASGIAGYEHILHATVHALNAFKRNENIAKDTGLEICVRASAQRQITKALDILGLKEGKMEICIVAVDCDEDIINKLESIFDKRDDRVLDPDENSLKEIYKISDAEIKTAGSIQNAIMERTTLLILET